MLKHFSELRSEFGLFSMPSSAAGCSTPSALISGLPHRLR